MARNNNDVIGKLGSRPSIENISQINVQINVNVYIVNDMVQTTIKKVIDEALGQCVISEE